MITLKNLAFSDRAIGSITAAECKLIAASLDLVSTFLDRWLLRRFIPHALREQGLSIRMLAAVLGRTPEEKIPLLEEIRMAMEIGIKK